MDFQEILDFWYQETAPQEWFIGGADFDAIITDRFSEIHAKASRVELADWRKTGSGRLAEIIVLDQFSRNIMRGSPLSFANDKMALILAQEALMQGIDKNFTMSENQFLYMPYMHSESLQIQIESVKLFEKMGFDKALDFAIQHYDIIKEFGRFPHRNLSLGRESTKQELAFLEIHSGF